MKRGTCVIAQSAIAPALARRFVCTTLDAWGVADGFADVPLVTSELVTNVVRHAASDVAISIALTPDRVRLEVSDTSRQVPIMSNLASARDGGWGMHIVERLSARWGLERRAGGKTVWCEVARSAA